MRTYTIQYFTNYSNDTIYKILEELEKNTDKIYTLSKNDTKNSIMIKTTSFNYNNFLRFIVEVDYNDIVDIDILK